MRKKGILKQAVALTLALGISLSGSLAAYAAEWKQDTTGWKVQNEDGSFIANTWYQSPTSLLWYYIGESGYMISSTWTPDGYYVSLDGTMLRDAWTPDGYYVGADGTKDADKLKERQARDNEVITPEEQKRLSDEFQKEIDEYNRKKYEEMMAEWE